MRNLKRALSLGLTAAMISGLMVMGSSAASYADVTSENNVEAIEVLQAVGVMVGDEDGNFNPDEYVTRNEMAVVMSNLLALNVSNFTSSSIPFTDVPDWAAPYVAACYADGITSGTSDTTYGGDDTVTAAQAGLMMLKALGYFQYSSDFGSDWQLAAVRQASSIDLYDGIDAGASTAMTRNEVAQLALNALEATMVEASSDGSTIVVGDITVSSNVSYDERTTSSTSSQYTAISDDEIDGNYTIELGEDLYDGDLEKRPSDTNSDVFGRPAITWEYQNDEIGTYADDPEETYTEGVDKEVLYDLIGSSVYNDLEDGDADLTVYLDGEILAESDVDADSVLEAFFVNGEDDDADFTGRGVLTQVYVDDDNNVTITMIRTYVAQVDGDYDADNEELVLASLDGTLDIPADTLTLSSDDFNNLDQFADEDYVLITAAEDEVQTIEAAEVITADGSRYYYNYTYTQARNDDRTESVTYDLNDDYTLVLDNYGYVVYSDGSEGVEDYVYVSDMADTLGVRSEIEAEAYFVDGTNEVITIDSVNAYNDSGRLTNVDADDYLGGYFDDYDNGAWYIYDEQSDGDYELTEVDEDDFRAGAVTDDGVEVVSTGSATVYYGNYEAPEAEKNFTTLLEMINASEAREDDPEFQSPVDLMFERLEEKDPEHFAVRQYKKFLLSAGKTRSSILISCGARLAPFDIRELRELMETDEMELDTLGDRKTALFVIISDTDDTFNFVVSILYTQLFNLLCDKADDVYGGRLPVHVRCLLDEFANIGQIPKFEKLIATIRSREISASIILQSQSQLKAIYKDNADTIVGNCDTTLFLGGKEKTTLKEISEILGKETIDSFNTSETRGRELSHGLNFQKLGKDVPYLFVKSSVALNLS